MKDTRTQLTLIISFIVALPLILILVQGCQDTGLQPAGITNLDSLTLSDDLIVGDDLTITDDLAIGDDTTFGDDFTVTGEAAFNGGIKADTNKFTVADTSGNTTIAGTLTATGATALNGGLAMDTNKFTVADTSGNTVVGGTLDVAGVFQYGANNLYPPGYATEGFSAVYGTDAITTTATAAHGLTTVTFALCTLGEDPTSGGGDAAMCTVSVSGNTVTLKAWQDDFVTAATETDVDVHWLVIGQN